VVDNADMFSVPGTGPVALTICAPAVMSAIGFNSTPRGAGLFGPVLGFRLYACLPLHVPRLVCAPALERLDVVDHVSRACAGCALGRWAGVGAAERCSRCVGALDPAAAVALAGLAAEA
jgi:hypothetical protein